MNQVDDLDGATGVALRDAVSANTGGEIKTWRGPEDHLPSALVDAISALPMPRGHAALIVFHRRDVDRCTAILQRAGIPLLPLEHYQGDHDDKLKIGTVHRAKGLEFQGVLAVHFTRHATASEPVEQEVRDLQERQHLVAATRARDFLWWATVEAT